MMIPVRPAQADQPLAEWALIELQGKVESLVGAAVTDIGVLLQGKVRAGQFPLPASCGVCKG